MHTANSPLGNRLGELLRLEKFPPPAGFSARAVVTDPSAYGLVGGAGTRAPALGHAVLLGAR